ncbi:MAG: DUF748 domain-containing protein [Chitinophagales bacterium]|nr:DUF748 domain-containing protein [Chitinophagales bacterium]
MARKMNYSELMLRLFRKIKNRFLRYALIIFLILFIFVAVVIIFISPIAKYIIEKYSEKYVGRKIEMSWLYVNPFSGYVNAHDLRVYEKKSPQIFIKTNNLSLNITVRKLFAKTYELSALTFDQLWINVIQDSTVFNFSDLIKTDSTKPSAPLHYCIRNINIKNSEFHYNELSIPVKYYITKVNISCPSLDWNVDTTHVEYNFISGIGSGSVKGFADYNMKSSVYNLHTLVSRFDLKIMEQYLKDFSKYGNISAFLDADIHAKGSVRSKLDLLANGKFAISDFHFGKNISDDYVSFASLSMNIDSLNPADKKYFFSSLKLDSPFIKYEKYDYLDNFARMFGAKGANIQEAKAVHPQTNIIFLIADYLKELAANIVNSQYRVDQFSITNAHLRYADYSLLEKFSLTANPIEIKATNISTRNKRMFLTMQSKLNPFGNVDVKFDVNPNDFGDFHLNYSVTDLPLPLFNPYTITYSSYPFDKGTIELLGKWNVVNKQINSDNHLLIINPTRADKVKNEGTKHIPMPIVLFLVRNLHRKIDITLPITGDLNNPKYHWRDVIWDVIANIFLKPPAFPYTSSVEKQKKDKEDFIMMEWKPMQTALNDDQKGQLRKISRYMFFHPNSHLTISPKYFEEKEKEAMLFFESKKKFYAAQNNIKQAALSIDDSVAITKLSIKDSSFVRYLDRLTNHSGLEFTVQGKCMKLIGAGVVNKKYAAILVNRKKTIMDFFDNKKTSDRITFNHGIITIPPSGFTNYIFQYKGDEPEAIKK